VTDERSWDVTPPWSKNQLRKLGECIRDGRQLPEQPIYADVMIWYGNLAASVRRRLLEVDWAMHGLSAPPEVTARAKTVGTLRDKLQRDRSTPLPVIQDVAGVRLEAEMTIGQQDTVAEVVRTMFGEPQASIKDLRANPHSGYRAVHVWLRTPAGRVEVQIRTHLQGHWANMYESLADFVGREVRYDEFPPGASDLVRNMVLQLRELSTARGAELEWTREQHVRMMEELSAAVARVARFSARAGSDPSAIRELRDHQAVVEAGTRELGTELKRQEESYTGLLKKLEARFATARSQASQVDQESEGQ
jgi:ppGpp synthetase/RelA/SpoT-type nucleotidyltranferase